MAKMTYVQAIDNAIAALRAYDTTETGLTVESIAKLEALKVQLEKRHSSGSRKPTKKQEENISIKQLIFNFLDEDKERYTPTEIGTGVGISCQKASQLLTQMQDAGLVIREKEGKKVYYRVA